MMWWVVFLVFLGASAIWKGKEMDVLLGKSGVYILRDLSRRFALIVIVTPEY